MGEPAAFLAALHHSLRLLHLLFIITRALSWALMPPHLSPLASQTSIVISLFYYFLFFLLNSGPSFHFDSVLCLFRDFGRWVSLGEHSDGDGGCRCPSPPPFVEEFHVAGNRASPVTAVCEPLKGAQSFSWHASFSHVGLITVFVFFVQGWETRCNFLNFFNWLDFLWIWMHDLFMILWIGWFAGEGFEDCMAVQEVFRGPARCWDS